MANLSIERDNWLVVRGAHDVRLRVLGEILPKIARAEFDRYPQNRNDLAANVEAHRGQRGVSLRRNKLVPSKTDGHQDLRP